VDVAPKVAGDAIAQSDLGIRLDVPGEFDRALVKAFDAVASCHTWRFCEK
jgi:hypothetical protein